MGEFQRFSSFGLRGFLGVILALLLNFHIPYVYSLQYQQLVIGHSLTGDLTDRSLSKRYPTDLRVRAVIIFLAKRRKNAKKRSMTKSLEGKSLEGS